MKTLKDIRIVGNKFIAQPGIESLKIKKIYKLGGGLLGGFLKTGDIITITDYRIDIDRGNFGTMETLNRLSESFFYNDQYFKRA